MGIGDRIQVRLGRYVRFIHTTVLFLCFASSALSQGKQLAFPTAEGFGKYALGGRGGKVYEVTNLKDSGPGSLRDAVKASGPRTIVFRVSGTIHLKSDLTISSPYLTIAGQTAPGDGICLKNGTLRVGGEHIIVRYLRVRLGAGAGEKDAVKNGGGLNNAILDHISASWSVDEVMSIYNHTNTTIQWCMITEALNNSIHKKGAHGYGGIWGGKTPTISSHHNLFAHNSSRNPRPQGHMDHRNCVIYNWKQNSLYGGESHYNTTSLLNVVANYYKPGPATPKGKVAHRIAQLNAGEWYIADNYVHGYPEVTADNWNGGAQGSAGKKLTSPVPHEEIKMQTAQEAFKSVLAHAGCSSPNRDAVDARIVKEVAEGNATFGNGIIDSPNDVGGWPELKSTTPPADDDHDGMADEWEKANGLNPKDPEDRNGIGKGGYTNLEIYINSLVKHPSGTTAISKNNSISSALSFGLSGRNRIEFTLPSKSNVKLELFSITGKRVATLLNEVKTSGKHFIDYAKSDVGTGHYICKLSTPYGESVRSVAIFN